MQIKYPVRLQNTYIFFTLTFSFNFLIVKALHKAFLRSYLKHSSHTLKVAMIIFSYRLRFMQSIPKTKQSKPNKNKNLWTKLSDSAEVQMGKFPVSHLKRVPF